MMSSCILLVPYCRLYMRPLQEALTAQWIQSEGSFDDVVQVTPQDGHCSTVVDSSREPFSRPSFLASSFSTGHYNRCVLGRLGRFPPGTQNHREMVSSRAETSHQSPRTASCLSGSAGIPSQDQRFVSACPDGQYHHDALLKQAGRYSFTATLSRIAKDLELASPSQHFPSGRVCPRDGQCTSRLTKQTENNMSRVGVKPADSRPHILSMGHSCPRPVRYQGERQMPKLCKLASPTWIPRECIFDRMVQHLCICFSTDSPNSQGPQEAESGTLHTNPNSPSVAAPTLVHRAPSSLPATPNSFETVSITPHNEQETSPTSRSSISQIIGLAPEFREFHGLDIPPDCKAVLARARADSTNKTYSLKWKRFCIWCKSAKIHPLSSSPE